MSAARVAHLATTGADGQPHLVPVTFALVTSSSADRIAIAVDQKPKTTVALRRLRNIAENPLVSLLCDHYDEDWTQLWWSAPTAVPSSSTTATAATAHSSR